ncbi:MAG: HPF/RaiA family ribosome-associated protein [Nanoarchaeota archaeon]
MTEKETVSPTIELSGFRDIDSSSREVIRANVERHVRKLSVHTKNMQNLHITLKTLHQREKSEIYDIHARLKDDGKFYVSHTTDRNLFAAIDTALEKLTHELD